jgi:hypothetical protein
MKRVLEGFSELVRVFTADRKYIIAFLSATNLVNNLKPPAHTQKEQI